MDIIPTALCDFAKENPVTECHAMLAAVLSQHDDDTVRLAYADLLDEHGQAGRAEFIRVQVELSRREWLVDPTEGHTCAKNPCPLCVDVTDHKRLWKRERLWIEKNRRAIQEQHKPFTIGLLRQGLPSRFDSSGRLMFDRGFVSHVHCSVDNWLANADRLFWSPKQMVRCESCGGCGGGWDDGGDSYRQEWEWGECETCDGSGYVTRPCQPTAQPVSRVVLTTTPPEFAPWRGNAHAGPWFEVQWYDEAERTFQTDRWPGITFHMAD